MKYLAVLFAIWVIAPCCLAAGCDGDCGGDTCYEGTEDSFLDCFSCSGTNYIYMGHDDIYGACFEDVEKCDDGNMPRDSTNQICYDDYECPDGFYMDATTYECTACDATCYKCSGALATECTQCPTDNTAGVVNHFLQREYSTDGAGSCVLTCSDGYYATSGYCTKCSDRCTECNGASSASCLTCPEEFPIKGVFDEEYEGICVAECINGAYDEDAQICRYSGICNDSMMRDNEKCTKAVYAGASYFNGILLAQFITLFLILF